MVQQIKDPALPEAAAGSNVRALSEVGTGTGATLAKTPLGTAATLNVGLAEGNLVALGAGGVLPAAAIGNFEPAHHLVQWSSSTRTLTTADNGTHVRSTAASPVLTIPTQAVGAFPADMMIQGSTVNELIINAAAGATVNGGASVTISAGGGYQLWRLTSDLWFAVTSGGSGAGTWPMVAVTGPTYALTASDKFRVLVVSTAVSFTIAADLGAGFQTSILNIGSVQPTFTVDGSLTLVTDGTAPLRMMAGPSAAAIFRGPAGETCILGLHKVAANVAFATASDHWLGTAGSLIATPESYAAAEAEQTGSPALTVVSTSLSISGGYFWNGFQAITTSAISIASISGIDGHARRVRLGNTSGGACSVTVAGTYPKANFGAGVSIPDTKTAAFVIENSGGEIIVTFAGYED